MFSLLFVVEAITPSRGDFVLVSESMDFDARMQ